VTSPSEEGSTDDFAATQLGNPWDMDATTDVEMYFQIPSRTITNIATETPGGTHAWQYARALRHESASIAKHRRRPNHANGVAAWHAD
jgi:hypothetical protein